MKVRIGFGLGTRTTTNDHERFGGLVDDLDRLGFDPLVTDAVPVPTTHPHPDDGAAVVAFANCPFARLADEQPDLVCGLHHGIVAGFVAEMGDAEIREFCTLTARTPCQVTIAIR